MKVIDGKFVSLGGAQYDGLSIVWAADPWSATTNGEYGFIHYSDNGGVSWTKSTGNCRAGYIVPFNGGLYGLQNLSFFPGAVNGWRSTNNGATWTAVTFHATNRFPASSEILQLGEFGGSLVAMVNGNNARSLWFSNDGINWFPAKSPQGIQNFAIGLGQFVAYTSSGAIIQAGSPPAGGSAPVVRADYPVHESSVINGSFVDVTGKAFDPEGGAIKFM